jgi:hypothetical protein
MKVLQLTALQLLNQTIYQVVKKLNLWGCASEVDTCQKDA